MILWRLLWRCVLFAEFVMLLRNLVMFLVIWTEGFNTFFFAVLTTFSWVFLLWIWWGVFTVQKHIAYVIFFTLVGLIHGLSDEKLLLEDQCAARLLRQLIFLTWVFKRRLYLGPSFRSYTCGKSQQLISSSLEHLILLLKCLEQVAHHLWLLGLWELLVIKLHLLLGEILLVLYLRCFSCGCVVSRFLKVRLIVL